VADVMSLSVMTSLAVPSLCKAHTRRKATQSDAKRLACAVCTLPCTLGNLKRGSHERRPGRCNRGAGPGAALNVPAIFTPHKCLGAEWKLGQLLPSRCRYTPTSQTLILFPERGVILFRNVLCASGLR